MVAERNGHEIVYEVNASAEFTGGVPVPELATVVSSQTPKRDIVDWLLRIGLALLFVFLGLQKFPTGTVWVRLFDMIGFGQWFRYVTGIVELSGGILLVIPAATALAVALLASAMIGALLVHVFVVGIGPPTVVATALLAGVLTIGWRRRAARMSGSDGAQRAE